MYLIYNVHLVGIKKKWLAARMHGVESFKVICYPRLHLFDCYECLARNARNERRNACTICLHVKCPLKTVIRQESWVPLWYNMAFRSQSGEFMHTELQWRAVKDTLRVCKGTGRGGGSGGMVMLRTAPLLPHGPPPLPPTEMYAVTLANTPTYSIRDAPTRNFRN